jgi:hypothetical protein
MVWQTSTLGLSWTYEFDEPSDVMALEFARRQTANVDDSHFMTMLVIRDNEVLYTIRRRVTVETDAKRG